MVKALSPGGVWGLVKVLFPYKTYTGMGGPPKRYGFWVVWSEIWSIHLSILDRL